MQSPHLQVECEPGQVLELHQLARHAVGGDDGEAGQAGQCGGQAGQVGGKRGETVGELVLGLRQ